MHKLDEKTKELIAIGVSYAINCQFCIEYHQEAGAKAGLSQEAMLAAIAVGETVRSGAHKKTKSYATAMFGEIKSDACCPVGSACCA